jgi:endonuclease/exonuclease/phosphatase family metal-dependent hydrolase
LASNPNLNFGEVSPNSTSDSQSFIFMAGGYGDFTIAAPLDYLLSVDNANFVSSLVVSQTEALTGKIIYAHFAPTTKALNLSGSLTITANGLNQEIGLFTGSSLPKTETFDIVTYNLEFFGSNVIGSTGSEFGPIDDALQIENVAKVMNKLNADVYVVQEVSDEPSLDLLIQKISINGKTFDKSVSPAWSYSFAPADPLFPDQKLVVLYNTQTTKVNKTRVMFSDLYDNIRAGNTTLPNYPGSSSSFFASGRLPYLVNVETNINGVKKEINLIDLHGRANSGSDISRYNMRKYDAEFLKDSLDVEYPDVNFMILGDYNDDVDVSVISPNPSSYQKMVEDTDRYNALTLEISKAGAYSYLGSGGFLDHIIVSNELTSEYVPNSVAVYDPRLDIANYVNTTSDHGPVIARFELKKQEQTIAFPSIIVSETVTSYDLTATATSGLNVTYTSSDETIARINNNTIQIVGAGTVTITATQSGNEYYSAAVDATQSLIITDTILPVIPTLANITQNNDNGFCGAIVNFVAPNGTDNFSGASTIQTAGLPSGAEYPIGTTTNTFQVTDASGNSAISSFNVTVTDTELPTLISSGNIIQKKEGKLHGVAVTYTLPVGNDNCTGFTITQTEGLSSGSIFPLGVTTNTFKIVDASGNTANCSFTVTVVQAITPKNSDVNPVLSVVAHPNPATDFVNITVKTDAPKNMTLRLYDIFGMLIGSPIEISGITTENTIQINVSNFRRGVYVFTLSTENKILFTDKIIKK